MGKLNRTKIKKAIEGRLEQIRLKSAHKLADDIQQAMSERRNYPFFKDSYTVRKNKSAPQPIAIGATRDLIDSGKLQSTVRVTEEGHVSMGGGTKYAHKIEDATSLMAQAATDFTLKDIL